MNGKETNFEIVGALPLRLPSVCSGQRALVLSMCVGTSGRGDGHVFGEMELLELWSDTRDGARSMEVAE